MRTKACLGLHCFGLEDEGLWGCLGLHCFGLEDEGLWGCLGLHCFGFGIVRTKRFGIALFRVWDYEDEELWDCAASGLGL